MAGTWTDKAFVLEQVKQDGSALQYAALELQSDREVVLAAVRQHGWAFVYASEQLLTDREVVLEAVQQNSSALQFASDELKSERERSYSKRLSKMDMPCGMHLTSSVLIATSFSRQ